VPDPETVEAVRVAVDPFMVHPLESEDAARAALLAYARQTEER
jgi:hypothetical protein